MKYGATFAFSLLTLIVSSGQAFAQNATPPPPQQPTEVSSENRALAETLFFTGRGLMEAKRYAQACVKFAESYRLDPAAGTLLNLAVCHEAEGKVASAWGEFRQALADARRLHREDREALAQEHIAKLEPELPFLTIVVPPAARVQGLEVKRNGLTLQPPTWDTELPVDPGTVQVVTSAPGYKPRTQTLTLENKQHAKIEVQPLELAPIDVSTLPYWTPKRKVGAVLMGAGVVGVGVGAWLGFTAISQRKDSDNNCPVIDGDRRCTAAGVDAMSKAKTSALISDIGIGVGAASLLVGGYLFFTGAPSLERTPPPAGPPPKEGVNVTWRVDAGPSGARGILSGTF